MLKKKWTIKRVVGILLAVSAVAVFIVTTVSIFSWVGHRNEIIIGGQVSITDSRTYAIYLQDFTPPLLDSYDFTFTNVASQNSIKSYAIKDSEVHIIINPLILFGAPPEYEKQIALVDLEVGDYIVAYVPREESGIFTWGWDFEVFMPRVFVPITWVAIPCYVLMGVYIVLRIRENRKDK